MTPSRLPTIPDDQAAPEAAALFAAAQARLGMVPNAFRVMAHAPAVLRAFMTMQEELESAVPAPGFRQRVAVLVARTNGSGYCRAVNAAVGRLVGLTAGDLADAEAGRAANPKEQAGLAFARAVVERRGAVTDAEFGGLLAAGCTPAEVAGLLGLIGWNVFANYFNRAARTPDDFPAEPG